MTAAANEIMTNREFVALVRAKLDAAGHRDVAIERHWISQNTLGHAFVLNVPVGAELVIPLVPTSGLYSEPSEDADRHINDFAEALVNLRAAEKTLTKYVCDVRQKASQEIAAAQATGLDVSLEGVALKPTYAHHLVHPSWKEAASHILAVVQVRAISFYLQPESAQLFVKDPEDVVDKLQTLFEDQNGRQRRLADLDAVGADLEVDAFTVDLLEAHGVAVDAILREVWTEQCVNLLVQHEGRDARLTLLSGNGRVNATFATGSICWNGEFLWIADADSPEDRTGLVGKTLAGLTRHPVLSSRPVKAVSPGHGGPDLIHFDLSDKLLFDAETGRIWRSEDLLAA